MGRQVPALDQRPLGPVREDRVGGPPHVVLALHHHARELRHLVQVRRGHGGPRQQLLAYGVQRRLGEQRVPVLGDPDGVHDGGRGGGGEQLGHRLHQRGRGQHPGLDRLYADVVHDGPVLGLHGLGGQLPDSLDPEGVLRGHGGHHAHPVHAECQHGLEVGLDPGATAGVGSGDGQAQRWRVGHLGVSSVDGSEPKWSHPPVLVQGAPSTVTWGSADRFSTSPMTFQRAGSFTSGGKVATMA